MASGSHLEMPDKYNSLMVFHKNSSHMDFLTMEIPNNRNNDHELGR